MIKRLSEKTDADKVEYLEWELDFRIDAAYDRKAFRNRKPELVDYMLWAMQFATKSEYVE